MGQNPGFPVTRVELAHTFSRLSGAVRSSPPVSHPGLCVLRLLRSLQHMAAVSMLGLLLHLSDACFYPLSVSEEVSSHQTSGLSLTQLIPPSAVCAAVVHTCTIVFLLAQVCLSLGSGSANCTRPASARSELVR